jgi:hypothetical protein
MSEAAWGTPEPAPVPIDPETIVRWLHDALTAHPGASGDLLILIAQLQVTETTIDREGADEQLLNRQRLLREHIARTGGRENVPTGTATGLDEEPGRPAPARTEVMDVNGALDYAAKRGRVHYAPGSFKQIDAPQDGE